MGTNTPPTTPERAQTAKAQSDTPISHNKTPSVHGSEIHIDASREAVVKDAGPSIPQVPFQFFQDNVLPKLPSSVDIAKTIAALRLSGVITREKRWKEFPKDPVEERPRSAATKAQRDQAEDKTFRRLIQVVQDIIAASEFDEEELKLEYLSMPNHVPICDYVSKTSKPDAYLVFRRPEPEPDPKQKTRKTKKKKKSTASRIAWREICCPAEYKLDDADDDVLDNVTKICWNMYQVMHEDPRRRFVYAFTIENTTMRVWFANRSEMIVSDPFNFITDHEKVARFFLSLMCAAQDLELGLDPTMQLRPLKKNEKPSYDMAVRKATGEEVFYRTRRLVDQSNAAALRGRGTRVWSVVRLTGKDGVEDEEHTGVLKDAWADADRSREGNILEQVRRFGEAEGNLDKDDIDAFRTSFLDVLVHGDVYIGEVPDNTLSLMMNNVKPSKDVLFSLQLPRNRPMKTNSRIHSATLNAGSAATASYQPVSAPADHTEPDENQALTGKSPSQSHLVDSTLPQPSNLPIVPPPDELELNHGAKMNYSSKTRYRIVFEQECTPLYKITSLRKAFWSLGDSVQALQFLHRSGWLHRDISTGNVLIDRNGVTRLADLEYAKTMGDMTSHDVRTGTANYMAVEVDDNRYAFRPRLFYDAPALPKGSLRELRMQAQTGARPTGPAPLPINKLRPGFRHNTLHDMESHWWMALDFVINRERSFLPAPVSSDVLDNTPNPVDDHQVIDPSTSSDSPTEERSCNMVHTTDERSNDQSDSATIVDPLHNTSPSNSDPENISVTEDDRKYARRVFYGWAARFQIMTAGAEELQEVLARLPPSISFIGQELLILKSELVKCYESLEKQADLVARQACSPDLYKRFGLVFWEIAKELEKIDDIQLAPLLPSDAELALYNNNWRARKVVGVRTEEGATGTVASGSKRKSTTGISAGGSKKQKVDE